MFDRVLNTPLKKQLLIDLKEISFLKNLSKFTVKHLRLSLFKKKFSSLQLKNFAHKSNNKPILKSGKSSGKLYDMHLPVRKVDLDCKISFIFELSILG